MISLFLCFSKPFDSHSLEYICIVLCHIKGSREAVTGAMALPLGLHFKGEEQFPRFTSKQLALVPLPFIVWSVEDNPVLPASLENYTKASFGPKSKSTSHSFKSFSSRLRSKWVLVRLQIVESKAYTDCT